MKWTTKHPDEPGFYWAAIDRSKRNPAPWVTVPAMYLIGITEHGEVWEIGKSEPTYSLDEIPEACLSGVKYARCTPPPDPWSPS